MADKDQVRKEETEKLNQEPEVTELDDKNLEEASGGVAKEEEQINGNCLC
jgi:hypothetical protein